MAKSTVSKYKKTAIKALGTAEKEAKKVYHKVASKKNVATVKKAASKAGKYVKATAKKIASKENQEKVMATAHKVSKYAKDAAHNAVEKLKHLHFEKGGETTEKPMGYDTFYDKIQKEYKAKYPLLPELTFKVIDELFEIFSANSDNYMSKPLPDSLIEKAHELMADTVIFTGKELREHWSSGKPIAYKGKEFLVNKQKGGYRGQEATFMLSKYGRTHKETDKFVGDELWLEKVDNKAAIPNDTYVVQESLLAQGGKIVSENYATDSAEELWNDWTRDQREHFLYDHAHILKVLSAQTGMVQDEKSFMEFKQHRWDTLPKIVKQAITEHMSRGQYAAGGDVEEDTIMSVPYGKTYLNKVITRYSFFNQSGKEVMKIISQGLYSDKLKEQNVETAKAATLQAIKDGNEDYRQEVFVHPKGASKPWLEKYRVPIEYKNGGTIKKELTNNQRIAAEIIKQFGGVKELNAMHGAYGVAAIENGVVFKIRNAAANYIKITQNDKQLYDIEVGRLRDEGKHYKVIARENDVTLGEIVPVVSQEAHMYISVYEKGGDVDKTKQPRVTFMIERGLWQGTKEDGSYRVFPNQSAAEEFAGIEYDADLDNKYYKDNFYFERGGDISVYEKGGKMNLYNPNATRFTESGIDYIVAKHPPKKKGEDDYYTAQFVNALEHMESYNDDLEDMEFKSVDEAKVQCKKFIDQGLESEYERMYDLEKGGELPKPQKLSLEEAISKFGGYTQLLTNVNTEPYLKMAQRQIKYAEKNWGGKPKVLVCKVRYNFSCLEIVTADGFYEINPTTCRDIEAFQKSLKQEFAAGGAISEPQYSYDDLDKLFNKGDKFRVHGWIMLKGVDDGDYEVTSSDSDTTTFGKITKSGKVAEKKSRFYKKDLFGRLTTYLRGDNNGIQLLECSGVPIIEQYAAGGEVNSKVKYLKKNKSLKVDAFTEEDDYGDMVVRIDYIEVPKMDRFKGEGKKEVESIIEWAKSIGAYNIVIESKRDAMPFWERMGFDIDDQGSKVSTGTLELKPKEEEDYAAGGEIVLNEGNGKVLNELYSQWDKIKTDAEHKAWEKKVAETKFGTYGTISIFEVLDNFHPHFRNEIEKKHFYDEVTDAIVGEPSSRYAYAEGGEVKKAKVTVNGNTWWLTKIDSTHFFMSLSEDKKGDPYHIGQMYDKNGDKAFYDDVDKWLVDKCDIEGNVYGSFHAQGGTLEGKMANVDWDAVYAPLTDAEEKEHLARMLKEDKEEDTKLKNEHAKRIGAAGQDWNDAFLKRVKSAKEEINDFVQKSNQKHDEAAKAAWNYSLEAIESVRELGFKARDYANALEKKLREAYDTSWIKNKKIDKFEEGGQISGTTIPFSRAEYEMLLKDKKTTPDFDNYYHAVPNKGEYAKSNFKIRDVKSNKIVAKWYPEKNELVVIDFGNIYNHLCDMSRFQQAKRLKHAHDDVNVSVKTEVGGKESHAQGGEITDTYAKGIERAAKNAVDVIKKRKEDKIFEQSDVEGVSRMYAMELADSITKNKGAKRQEEYKKLFPVFTKAVHEKVKTIIG